MVKKQTLYLFLITFVLIVRIAYHAAHPDIYSDNIAQIATAQNFMEGHGFSFKYVNSELKTYYKTDIQYPPLYSFLLALITFITGNPLISSLIIQIAVILLLVVIWKKIFNLLKPFISDEAYYYFISLLLVSTSIFNVINTLLFVALLLFTFSVYFILSYLLNNDSKKLNLFFSSFFSSLLFWTHYSNFFVAFYPSLLFFIIFYISRNKTYLRGAFSSFIISLVVTSGLLFYNYITTGFINYMENPAVWKTGFFIEHLLLVDPFFLNAFFKSSYIPAYLFSNNQPVFLTLLYHIISFTIFGIIIFLFFRLMKNSSVKFENISLLFITFFVIIVLVILFLLYPSLRYYEIPLPGWTHIGEPRYLSIVYLSIIMIVIMLVFNNIKYISKKFIRVAKIMMLLVIFINLLVIVYAFVSDIVKYNYKTSTYNQDHQDLSNNIKLELSRGNLPVFIDSDLIVDSFRMSQLAKAAVIHANDVEKIKKFPPNIIFFFTVPDENNFRDIDSKLMEWASQFSIERIGQVRSLLPLYKVKIL